MSNATASPKRGQFQVGFHDGNIVTFLSQTYKDLAGGMGEIVQNQIDACDGPGGRAFIILDLRQSTLKGYDNGVGASREAMRERIANIGAKLKTVGKIGEKGIGNLAGISIGRRYRIITRSRDQKPKEPFFELVLDRRAVDDQKKVAFEWEEMEPGFNFSGEQEGMSTYIDIQNISDSMLAPYVDMPNPAEEIAQLISNTYSSKLIETKMNIDVKVIKKNRQVETVRVSPIQFPGKKTSMLIETAFGAVDFQVYLTNEQVKKPVVNVDHQGRYAFPLQNLVGIWSQIKDFFGSGHVQAIIRVNFCTLTADRHGFDFDDKLDAFYVALREFTAKYGRPWLATLRERNRSDQYANMARRAFEQLNRTTFSEYPELAKALAAKAGVAMTGPVKIPRLKIRRENDDVPQIYPTPITSPKEEEVERDGGLTPKVPREPRIPPKTPPIKKIGGVYGLSIIFREGDPEHGNLWRARFGTKNEERGCIIINLTHPDLTNNEQKGKARLQQYISYLVSTTLVKTLIDNPTEALVFQKYAENTLLQFLGTFASTSFT